jgi:hypothetical protein
MLVTLHTKMKVLNIVTLLMMSQHMMMYDANASDIVHRDSDCEPGYGRQPEVRRFGPPCYDKSKITTEAECRLAAEYNRKKNVPYLNGGFANNTHSLAPPGCYVNSLAFKSHFNHDKSSTKSCSVGNRCICKADTCTKCPINTYNVGANPICTPCPKERPTTNFRTGQENASACMPISPLTCKANYGVTGDGIEVPKTCTNCENGKSTGGIDAECACKPGYGQSIFTSGSASQCSGVSKITTEAECRAAAEYNKKNNIDTNHGYWGRFNRSWVGKKRGGWSSPPPGCFFRSESNNKGYNNEYYFNNDTKSTTECSNRYKCICKPKTCTQCPINTYSKGGIKATCTRCPSYAPNTASNLKIFHSINVCTKSDTYYCDAGFGYNIIDDAKPIRKSGHCTHKITSEEDCRAAAEYNKKNKIHKNDGYSHQMEKTNFPPGCFHKESDKKYYFNSNLESTLPCQVNGACICKIGNVCAKCQGNTYKSAGTGACKICPKPFVTNDDHTKCYNPEIKNSLKQFEKRLSAQKEIQNDLSIKNSRLWQKEQIRLQHDEYMQARKEQDDENEKELCIEQRSKGTIIFPAIEIAIEMEKIEDTTCIDTNRDELLKSFCSFTSDLDELFKIQKIDKPAKSFWPNICCKERSDTTLEACKDPSGHLARGKIIPFALSSGGNYSRHNLYAEVTDTIKRDGYLHKGMKDLLKALGTTKTKHAKTLVDSFFNEVSLCGPRIVDAPGAKDKKKLCELFIPYQHAMTQFYNLIASLYKIPIKAQESTTNTSFLETMGKLLRKRQLNYKNRLGKNGNINIQQIMQAKPSAKTPKAEQQCKHAEAGTTWTSHNLVEKKQMFCKGYNHLDLSNDPVPSNIKNIAVHYLKDDIVNDDKVMFSLKQTLRYAVNDNSCPAAPLFTAKDISIQQVNMDTLGKEKEWVAVVNLNTQDKNSYLQSELPYCENRDYLIGAKVQVKAYVDNDGCCDGWRDYNKCKEKDDGKCKPKLIELKHFSKTVEVTGTDYNVNGVNRRRQLLQSRASGC